MKLPVPRKVEAYECPECGGLFLERDHAEACAELDRIEPGIEVIATDVVPLMRVRPEVRAIVDEYLKAGEDKV